MEKIKPTIQVSALCDKAGRRANQDSIYMSCADMMTSIQTDGHEELHSERIPLASIGTLLAVADGMGGMNAGEVASQLVVDTLANEVTALADHPPASPAEAAEFAMQAILDADKAIKYYVASHSEAAGTGSTIALLWILGQKAVVAWCGDSRCYRYNPRRGLEQLSHDHSFVQQLVDEGKLPPELALGHDQSNIITRCLSDDPNPAEPEALVVDVYRDDVFLLCSDGLSGLLPDEVIEQLLKDTNGDVRQSLSNCWRRGEAEGWDDNVSIILASIHGVEVEASERPTVLRPQRPSYSPVPAVIAAGSTAVAVPPSIPSIRPHSPRRMRWIWIALAAVVVAAAILFCLCGPSI